MRKPPNKELLNSSGEEQYSLDEAQEVRVAVARMYETVDQLSKKILMEMDGEEGARNKQLHQNIRKFALKYLQVGF